MRRLLALCCAMICVGCNNETPTVAINAPLHAVAVDVAAAPLSAQPTARPQNHAVSNPDPLPEAAPQTVEAAHDEPLPAPLEDVEKVREFKEKVAPFLEEVRAGAKLLTDASLEEIQAKSRQIKVLKARIPAVPPEIDETDTLSKFLISITVEMNIGEVQASTQRYVKGAKLDILVEKQNETADKLNKMADVVESALDLDLDVPLRDAVAKLKEKPAALDQAELPDPLTQDRGKR